MANPSTYPSDGRITSLQNYTANLAGTELLQLVAPGNATAGVNYNITVTQMLSGVFSVLPAQPANVVLAGPTIGAGTATPAFRALVLADIPGGTSGFPLVGNNATSAPSYQILGLPGGGIGTTSLSADGVVLANGTNAFSVVAATTAGLVLTSQGSTSPPTWNATSGGTVFSVATGTGLIGGPVTGVGTVSLSVPVTVPNGGSGTTALLADGVVLGNGSSPLSVAGATTAGYPFVSNGSTSSPSFQVLNLAAGTFVSGVLPLANGGIGTSALPLNGVVLGNSPALKVVLAATSQVLAANNGTAVWTGAPILSTSITTPEVLSTGSLTIGVGTGNGILFQSNGQTIFSINPNSAPVVNYAQWNGNITGNSPFVLAQGSDTNVGLTLITKGTGSITLQNSGAQIVMNGAGSLVGAAATPLQLGGNQTTAYLISSVVNFGIFCGTGVPSIAAGTGSLYLRNDGATATTRIYVNQNGSTTWVGLTATA